MKSGRLHHRDLPSELNVWVPRAGLCVVAALKMCKYMLILSLMMYHSVSFIQH